VRFVTAVCLIVAVFAANSAQADPTDNSLQIYVVQMLSGSKLQHLGGAGVYLGNGLVITAAHVATPNTGGVRIDGQNVSAKIVKRGEFEKIDLALLSMDEGKLPVSLRLRRMPLCQRPPRVGAPVIVAAPQGITRSRIMSPLLLPLDVRTRFSTVISEVGTDGKSGSGVFDVEKNCLLGILSLKIISTVEHKDIATYFVPAHTIQSFVPTGTRW
jgi:hypothetical protein